jgi:hypothetical protein
MEKVTVAINNMRHLCEMDGPVEKLDGPCGDMLHAASEFSRMAMYYIKGELQRKALALCATMADFAHEAANPT